MFFSKRNFGGGSLMVWGAFSSTGTLSLAFPSCRMNSDEYIQVLQANLLPFLEDNEENRLIFQQDNAAIHKSNATTDWLIQHNINVLKWPACSPDMNPIENLWGILVRRVYAENKQYQSVNELQIAIIQAWEGIQVDTLRQLVRSMPNRLFELIQSNGGPTRY
jgi:transposase